MLDSTHCQCSSSLVLKDRQRHLQVQLAVLQWFVHRQPFVSSFHAHLVPLQILE